MNDIDIWLQLHKRFFNLNCKSCRPLIFLGEKYAKKIATPGGQTTSELGQMHFIVHKSDE